MAKAARKEMAGRITSRSVRGGAGNAILEGHGGRKQRRRKRKRDGVGAADRSRGRRPVRRCIISSHSLESGEQKCSKAEHGVIRHGRQDKAKKGNIRGVKTRKKFKAGQKLGRWGQKITVQRL